MPSDEEKESWTIDQITKSEFFHQKLHEWGLLENPKRIGYYRKLAMVSQKSMSRVGLSINIHKGGKGLRDFAPKVGKSADFRSKSYFSSKVGMRERFRYNSNLFKNKKLRNFR
ncbi:MAG: hypothetical protein U9O85_11425 [Euryarchaeota archaeon]|nr:hypothetical protein [Euryarchaeota archaeon]